MCQPIRGTWCYPVTLYMWPLRSWMVSSAIQSQHYFAVNLPASEDIVCKPNIFIIIGNCAVDVFNIVCIQYHVLCACIFNATNSNWSVQCVFSIACGLSFSDSAYVKDVLRGSQYYYRVQWMSKWLYVSGVLPALFFVSTHLLSGSCLFVSTHLLSESCLFVITHLLSGSCLPSSL